MPCLSALYVLSVQASFKINLYVQCFLLHVVRDCALFVYVLISTVSLVWHVPCAPRFHIAVDRGSIHRRKHLDWVLCGVCRCLGMLLVTTGNMMVYVPQSVLVIVRSQL